jgi:hypothetical protein
MAKVVAPGQNETESDSLRQLGTDSDKMGWDSLTAGERLGQSGTFSKEWGHFVVRCCANFVILGLFGRCCRQ